MAADGDVVFYAVDWTPVADGNEIHLPDGYTLTVWHPTIGRPLPPSDRGVKWIVWALFHALRIFASDQYGVVQVRRGQRLVHRSALFPKYFRFPFMKDSDLQVGDTWTHPDERGKGVAVAALRAARQRALRPESRLWYLTTAANPASIRVAERAGLTLVGVGVRRRRCGLRLLGAYTILGAGGAS